MTTVKFTQRIKDVLTRQLDYDFASLMSDIVKQFDSNTMMEQGDEFESIVHYNKDFQFKIVTCVNAHEDDCVGYPFAPNMGCDCPKVREVIFQIMVKYKGSHLVCFPMFETSLKKMIKKINKDFPKSLTICLCGTKTEDERDKCRRCFIYSYTRTEEEGGDCSICLENDGLWIKTKCGHTFHQHCLKKATDIKKQCPMCRANVDLDNDWEHTVSNPYNV